MTSIFVAFGDAKMILVKMILVTQISKSPKKFYHISFLRCHTKIVEARSVQADPVVDMIIVCCVIVNLLILYVLS